MPLHAVQNHSLADQVFQQLFVEIVVGSYTPGTALPAERALAETLGVNRHVVREALKRLEQLGLLKIAQGGATQVLDFKYHAGLDLLAMLAEHVRGSADISHWLSVLEMRAAIGADVVRLCALRASQSVRDELVQISDEMKLTNDQAALFALEVRFWDRLLEGSGNIAYRLAFNTLVKGSLALGERAIELSIYEIEKSGRRESLARAVAAGDAEHAEAEIRSGMHDAIARYMELAGISLPPPKLRQKTPKRS
jgi:GntR family transcriptional regulator, transcriptional repressor for pyruvate dehydrogenase complex